MISHRNEIYTFFDSFLLNLKSNITSELDSQCSIQGERLKVCWFLRANKDVIKGVPDFTYERQGLIRDFLYVENDGIRIIIKSLKTIRRNSGLDFGR